MKSTMKLYQLNGTSACNKRRHFGYQVNDTKTENYYKAVAIMQAAKSVLKGKSMDEIEEELNESFADIPYQEQQRKLLISDAMKQIKRYVDWETRPLADAVTTTLDLYGKLDVEVTPNYIVADATPVVRDVKITTTNDKGKAKTTTIKDVKVADGYIEIIKLKTGKPKNMDDSLELLSLLMYGRKFYRQGKLMIKASYYYLTRTDDSYGQHPSFQPFDEKQIRTLEEVYEGKPNETDVKYIPLVDDFVNGHEEHECDPKDCEKCILYTVCKGYSDGPKMSEREIITKVGDIMLNPAQQEAIDY